MADNVFYAAPGSGTVIGVDVCTVNGVAGVGVPLGKIGYGANDSFTYVTASAGLPVAQQGTWAVTANIGTAGTLALEAGHLATIDGKTPALGQALAAASVPVVLTAAQVATLTPPAAITGFALEAGNLATIATNTAGLLTVSDFDTKAGSLTETAPATDTASSGLNGRLQRIAQRITSLLGLFPSSLGQKASAASLAVVVASDQSAVPVSGTFWQATQPISGTITANAGTGNFTVVQATGSNLHVVVDTAPTTAVTGTFWQATQPVSGTITANAGTGTFTIGGNVASGATDSGNPAKVGGVYNSSPITLTTGQRGDAQLDASGFLKVNVAAGGAAGGTSSTFGSAFPATGTAIGFKDSAGTNLAAGNLDASGFLKVNVAAGSGGNGAASATGSAVPAQGDYGAVNVGGTLRGQTGVNPSGTVYAAQTDLASVGGATFALGQALAAASVPVVLTAAQVTTLTPFSSVTANAGTGTFAVSASSLPLPTGAAADATVAKLTIAQGTALGSNTQALAGGSVTTAAPTYTTGQISPVSLTTAGAMRVDASATTQPVSGTVTANIGTAGTLALEAGNLATLAGAVTSAKVQSNVAQINAVTPLMGNGVTGTGSQRVTIASDNTAFTVNAAQSSTWNITNVSGTVSLPTGAATDATVAKLTIAQGATLGSNTQAMMGGSVTTAAPTYTTGQVSPLSLTTAGAVRVDASGTTQPVSGTVTVANTTFGATQSGTWNLGTVTTVSAVTAITNALPAGTNLLGKVGIDQTTPGTTNAVSATIAVPTSGGATPGHYLAAASANQDSTVIKGSAGQLYSWSMGNPSAATRYVKLYDKATAPTSADTPVATYFLPAGGGSNVQIPIQGRVFASGIGFRITSGQADNDAGAATAGDVVISYDYK